MESQRTVAVSVALVVKIKRMLTVFRMIGKNVPRATATTSRQMYDTKNTYVLGREKTWRKALVSHVTSVYRLRYPSAR